MNFLVARGRKMTGIIRYCVACEEKGDPVVATEEYFREGCPKCKGNRVKYDEAVQCDHCDKTPEDGVQIAVGTPCGCDSGTVGVGIYKVKLPRLCTWPRPPVGRRVGADRYDTKRPV